MYTLLCNQHLIDQANTSHLNTSPITSNIYSTETKYVWAFNDSWSQWSSLEDKAVMIIYAAGTWLDIAASLLKGTAELAENREIVVK